MINPSTMNIYVFIIFFLIKFNLNAMDLFENILNTEKFNDNWELITDQVMGGKSTGNLELVKKNNEIFLRLSGEVSTENNGGFIQARKGLKINNTKYSGIKIKVKGTRDDYFIHIRTSMLIFPWQYYAAKFKVDKSWSEIRINFEEFSKSNFYQPSSFTSSDIESIAIVAYGKDFSARVEIKEAELF